MRRVVLEPPRVSGSSVEIRWRVDPPSELYRRCHFTLRFPEALGVGALPERVWWWTALACLHPHWALLAPCRVHLPVGLPPGEAEVWSRLALAARVTLEAHRPAPREPRPAAAQEPAPGAPRVEIVAEGPALAPLAAPPAPGGDGPRCAAAFSAGKDSLLQAGLLAELTQRPLLVSTTSPLPKLEDHGVPWRRRAFREIPRRLPVEWLEVESDYRSSFRNRFSAKAGFGVTVNELCDTMLYAAALVAAGLASGATRFFVASEAEVQESTERGGWIVQHPHAMYATATLRALGAALGADVHLGSLTVPLHCWQVQRLLWTRHASIADLQFSCWRAQGRRAACSTCGECMRVAYGVLAAGGRPSEIGIDLRRLLRAQAGWEPGRVPDDPLPRQVVGGALYGQQGRLVADTPLEAVAADLRRGPLPLALDPRGRRALDAARRLKERMQALAPPALPGFREGFARQVDPLLREPVLAIVREHFEPADPQGYAGALERSERLAARLCAPLAQRAAAAGAASRPASTSR